MTDSRFWERYAYNNMERMKHSEASNDTLYGTFLGSCSQLYSASTFLKCLYVTLICHTGWGD